MAKTKFTKDAMRARLAELEPEIAELDALIAPLQAEHDEIANYRREDEVRIDNELKELNARRADLTSEKVVLIRAVGGAVNGRQDVIEVPAEAVAE